MKLDLLPITMDSTSGLSEHSSETARQVMSAVLDMYPSEGPVWPWVGYLAKEGDNIVGTCAFKSAPVDGEVEIAYFTFPGNEGRGVAYAMAMQLRQLAAEAGVIVKAQTLPAHGASTRILRKMGLVITGSVAHPTDGEVWEWREVSAP
jgi:[ribosomal protein S5]-alanine N-acetyltransferase